MIYYVLKKPSYFCLLINYKYILSYKHIIYKLNLTVFSLPSFILMIKKNNLCIGVFIMTKWLQLFMRQIVQGHLKWAKKLKSCFKILNRKWSQWARLKSQLLLAGCVLISVTNSGAVLRERAREVLDDGCECSGPFPPHCSTRALAFDSMCFHVLSPPLLLLPPNQRRIQPHPFPPCCCFIRQSHVAGGEALRQCREHRQCSSWPRFHRCHVTPG